jgi:hypothetical protein
VGSLVHTSDSSLPQFTTHSLIHFGYWLFIVHKNMDSDVNILRFKFHLLHSLLVWPWTSYLILLCSSFLTCHIRKIMLSQWDHTYIKHLKSARHLVDNSLQDKIP